MKVCLDLCCGKGGATQAFRDKPDWVVVGVDVDKRFYQQWQGKNVSFVLADVTAVDWQTFLEDVGIPHVDFLWASPPCTHFSTACWTFPRKGIQKALEIVGACWEAVFALKPHFYLIENPRGRLRRFLPNPSMTIFYSDFDKKYPAQKPTDFWSNFSLPMARFQRRPHAFVGITDPVKRHHLCSTEYVRNLGKTKEDRAFVPLGVSEAVYTSVQSRLLSAGSSTEESAATAKGPK